MQMSLFLISQGSNYGYNLVDGFQSAFSQIIDFISFFCIMFFLAVLEKQNQSHSNRAKKIEWLI